MSEELLQKIMLIPKLWDFQHEDLEIKLYDEDELIQEDNSEREGKLVRLLCDIIHDARNELENNAGVAQSVERDFAKVKAEGSSPFTRSN